MSWQTKYLSALQTRDESEQSVKRVFENYTALADRLAHLENPPAASTASPAAPTSTSPRPDGSRRGSTPDRRAVASPHAAAELAEAQRARAALEAKTKEMTAELEAARATAKVDRRRVAELAAESQGLGKRVRDRDEELREKAKLLDDVHNETVALTIQLNVMEEQNAKLRVENRELVDRWMARMGREADAMNDASDFR